MKTAEDTTLWAGNPLELCLFQESDAGVMTAVAVQWITGRVKLLCEAEIGFVEPSLFEGPNPNTS